MEPTGYQAFATHADWKRSGKEFCELFDLPVDGIASLTICIEPDSIVEVRAKLFATKEQLLRMGQIVKRYQLLPLSQEES